MTSSEDSDNLPHRPRVPRNAILTDSDESASDEPTAETPEEPLYANPDKLNQVLSSNAIESVTVVGPIHAEYIQDVSPTGVTVGAEYEPVEDDGVVDNVYALANSEYCVGTDGCKRIDGRYVPSTLEFERAFKFDREVADVDELRTELQSVFGYGISITESNSPDE